MRGRHVRSKVRQVYLRTIRNKDFIVTLTGLACPWGCA